MRKIQALLIIGAILAAIAPAWGHGTEGLTEKAEGILISAGYDDGEPMSYAEVEIIGPDSDTPFQKGRTDRNGMFMFRPDRNGLWQIIVSDGMGHRLALEREITDGNGGIKAATPAESVSRKASRPQGIIMGMSIIFGLFGIAYGWKARSR
ncbi:hypothetical protein [Desulfobacter curvatus]|uniref:hypothetical protein n=1 Tax=Desulfobacter curvatus TaxID=2290 RepID=UPI0012FCFC57|nr:hypothetical protein [Desulfobacter curvatus]